jgi:hypothetical protein
LIACKCCHVHLKKTHPRGGSIAVLEKILKSYKFDSNKFQSLLSNVSNKHLSVRGPKSIGYLTKNTAQTFPSWFRFFQTIHSSIIAKIISFFRFFFSLSSTTVFFFCSDQFEASCQHKQHDESYDNQIIEDEIKKKEITKLAQIKKSRNLHIQL